MPFDQVRTKKSALYIADQIVDAVRRGEFSTGDPLPPERDLARMFGVSRQALREGLTALQLVGVVETRAGLGTFVRQNVRGDIDSQIWSLDHEERPEMVLEARLIVEPEGAALAAGRMTELDQRRLISVVDAMKRSTGDPIRFSDLDLQFHVEVAEASGNPLIARFVKAAVSYATQTLSRSVRESAYEKRPNLAEQYTQHHVATLEALLGRDARAAAASMRKHLKAAEFIWFGEAELPSGDQYEPRTHQSRARRSR